MTRLEQIHFLNEYLLGEMPVYRAQAGRFPMDVQSQRRLLRSLMNVRPPQPLNKDFLYVQDALLAAERAAKGVVDAAALPECLGHPGIALWQGDITRLKAITCLPDMCCTQWVRLYRAV